MIFAAALWPKLRRAHRGGKRLGFMGERIVCGALGRTA